MITDIYGNEYPDGTVLPPELGGPANQPTTQTTAPPEGQSPATEQTQLERLRSQERSFETPAAVSDDVANRLADNPPDETHDLSNSPDTDSVIAINRRIAAGETLTNAELKAAKEWLPGSYQFYQDIRTKPEEAPKSEKPTIYFENKEDWEAAGRPGGTEDKRVVIGEKPPQGASYEKPDKTKLWVGVLNSDAKEQIERTPELDALKVENPKLYKVLVNEGWENYQKAVNAENFVNQQEDKRFRVLNTQLPDGSWIAKDELRDIEKNTPDIYRELTRNGGGVGAANKFIEEETRRVASNRALEVPTTVGLLSEAHTSAERSSLIKALYRGLTPWNEKAGETVLSYMKGYPARVKMTYIEAFRGKVPTQEALKAQYQQEQDNKKGYQSAPLWARVLFPAQENVLYDKKSGTYYTLVIGEAEPPGKSKIVRAAQVLVKERIDWKKVTQALEDGQIKTAKDAERWAEINKAFQPPKSVGRPQPGPTKQEIRKAERALARAEGALTARMNAAAAERSAATAADDLAKWKAWKAGYEAQQAGKPFLAAGAVVTTAIGNNQPRMERVWTQYQAEQLARETDTQSVTDVRSRTIEQALQQTQQFAHLRPEEWQQVSEAIKEGVNADDATREENATNSQTTPQVADAVQAAVESQTATKTQPQNQPATQTKQQTKTGTRTLTRPQVKAITREILKTSRREPSVPPPLRVPSLDKRMPDRDTRAAILSAHGAIAWRQGKVGNKDRYDVIINPYRDDEDYLMVLGAPPAGAAIATGARSAYRTAKVLYGQPPRRKVTVDSGAQDIVVTPNGKRVSLDFNPDPKGLTKGDITIGGRRPTISERRAMISSGKRARITPARPRIGR